MKNEPAFPHPQGWRRDGSMGEGMTLRDYFAAKALPFCLQNAFQYAEAAYQIADAMLKERAK